MDPLELINENNNEDKFYLKEYSLDDVQENKFLRKKKLLAILRQYGKLNIFLKIILYYSVK